MKTEVNSVCIIQCNNKKKSVTINIIAYIYMQVFNIKRNSLFSIRWQFSSNRPDHESYASILSTNDTRSKVSSLIKLYLYNQLLNRNESYLEFWTEVVFLLMLTWNDRIPIRRGIDEAETWRKHVFRVPHVVVSRSRESENENRAKILWISL